MSDITVKSREKCSDKPETYYHLSPKPKTAEEEVFSLGDSDIVVGNSEPNLPQNLKLTILN